MTKFKKVNPKQSFPKLEEEILKFWEEEKIFEESLKIREEAPEFNFYDGPPFATGTPHYGHILAGTIKDVIPRYQTMKGHRVDRKFGWDCHGLPIENIVEKKLGISGKDDIEGKIGVFKFNEECRANVFGYVDEWKKTVSRMGRWVDMENDYKTMDTDFMESVWWVYKSIYDKGLIYEGHRVVPYCPRCSTPLSNFEVNQGYKDKQDKTVTVKFKVKGSENKYILAWTTTPWTLVANLGLAVGKDITYVELHDLKTKETIILARDRVNSYYKNEEDFSIVREYKGECLIGIKYEPIFDDFWTLNEANSMPLGMQLGKNAFSVVAGHHVTTETGTGVVHIAPAYGEDDSIIGKESDLGFVAHIGDNGNTQNLLTDNGIQVFEFNELAIRKLKETNQVVQISTIDHSYPHCWRCESPLIYRAISAWYVGVEKFRDQMVANNQEINWTPEVIKNGRFGKWLEGARDWNISRNRYWGSAIPVWQNEDKSQEVCVGSIKELYDLNRDFGQITKIIFVRHGRTDYNEKSLFDFQNKAKLNQEGKKQAQQIAKIFENENIDIIYSSPLDRCVDTISPLANAKGLEINKIQDLIEINATDLQDKEYSCKNFEWENGYGGGETIKQVYERLQKAFKKIIDDNKGKTIVICSHGDPTFLLRMSLNSNIKYTQKYTCGKALENNPKKYDISKIYGIDYIYSNSGNEIDLHKHFVDEILVKNEKNSKAKKVLGIHGWNAKSPKNLPPSKWYFIRKHLEKNGIIFDVPEFDKSENTKYSIWKEELEKYNIYDYDTIVAASFGCPVILQYLQEKNIHIKRLVLQAPSGLKGNKYLEQIINEFTYDIKKIKDYCDELIVTCSKDDESDSASYEYSKNFAKESGANFIEVDGIGHKFNGRGGQLLAELSLTGTPLKRIPEVLDCWFESGSMPYASKHYPFDCNPSISPLLGGDAGKAEGGKDNFKFPADFIAEGLDQTRGWFYTLLILGTALFNKAPMKNVIVNGTVLAEDGFKMSKSKKNYPDPQLIFDNYGADAMRFYLMNSPVVEAQDFRFAESGVEEVVKKVILPLWNTYYFFTTYANIDNFKPSKSHNLEKTNNLDKWLISELNELTKEVSKGFDEYKLNEAAKPIVKFMDNLTNWYIRRSRKRFWKSENDTDKLEAYETLYYTLVELTKIIAPFMPFISDYIYKNLTGEKSVHLTNFPTYNEKLIDEQLNSDTDMVQKIITLGLAWRANNKIRVRQPLNSITITQSLDDYYIQIIKEELNVKNVLVVDGNTLAKQICKPNGRAIGPKFGSDVKFIMSEAKSGNFELLNNGNVKVGEFELEAGDFELVFEAGDTGALIEAGFGMVIAMDPKITKELKLEGFARDLVRQIQEARKEADYQVDDRIQVSILGADEVVNNFKEYIENETLSTILDNIETGNIEKEIELDELGKVNIKLKK